MNSGLILVLTLGCAVAGQRLMRRRSRTLEGSPRDGHRCLQRERPHSSHFICRSVDDKAQGVEVERCASTYVLDGSTLTSSRFDSAACRIKATLRTRSSASDKAASCCPPSIESVAGNLHVFQVARTGRARRAPLALLVAHL